MSRSRQLSVFLVSSCLALALAACGGGDDDDTRPQPTTTAPETTQSQEEQDEAALRQLAEDWYEFVSDAYRTASDSGDADRYLTDPYLSDYESSIAEHVASGNSSESSEDSGHEIRSIEVAGAEASIEECIVDADVLRGPDGGVLNDEVVAQLVRTSASLTGEGWRLSDRQLVSEQEGAVECGG
jgi:hypothetical protein